MSDAVNIEVMRLNFTPTQEDMRWGLGRDNHMICNYHAAIVPIWAYIAG